MSTQVANFSTTPPPATRRLPRRISKTEFLRDYSDRADGFKYELNNGVVEKFDAMNQQQATMQAIFLRHFITTQVFREGGMFTAETDMDTLAGRTRRPDLAIYTGEQVKRMKDGQHELALWVAEVISPNDKAEDVEDKMEEYFRAGVQVVWHIYPRAKKVEVFTSPDHPVVCRGAAICSGGPALPDLEIPAGALFE